ncbi:MAG: hypothetical protein NTX23_01785 [Candidatus Bipolaricaulota bacterium]|nr:hypothetical protein [Candidatus Bipolaricaulota bacterium]
MSRRAWVLLCVSLAVVAVAAVLAWPPADPFAGVKTVALRTSVESASPAVDVAAELEVVLGNRNLRIVSDERTADVVLAVTNARFDLGNVQLALNGGKLSGRATAVCRVVNVKTNRAYVMDLVMTLRDGNARANLVGRRFWEFWKPRPSF